MGAFESIYIEVSQNYQRENQYILDYDTCFFGSELIHDWPRVAVIFFFLICEFWNR